MDELADLDEWATVGSLHNSAAAASSDDRPGIAPDGGSFLDGELERAIITASATSTRRFSNRSYEHIMHARACKRRRKDLDKLASAETKLAKAESVLAVVGTCMPACKTYAPRTAHNDERMAVLHMHLAARGCRRGSGDAKQADQQTFAALVVAHVAQKVQGDYVARIFCRRYRT